MIYTLNRDQQCQMWSSFFNVGMLAVLSDGGQFRTSLECSTHLVLFPLSLLAILPCLSLTKVLVFTFFPNGILLISYSFFKSYCLATVSASSVMSWTNCFPSFLALFLTCLSALQYPFLIPLFVEHPYLLIFYILNI